MLKSFVVTFLFLSLYSFGQSPAFVYGDLLPDAPELAARGSYSIGVQTVSWVNPGQIDVLRSKRGVDTFYNRKIVAEVWYPAALRPNQKEEIQYDELMGTSNDPKRPLIPFKFAGRACRDADPSLEGGKFPLIIVSHGYVGSRYLMTYLTENLASKGYVVVALDHTESTFRDAGGFPSTLLNRSKDVIFALNEITKIAKSGKNIFSQIVDTDNVGLVGYSMGGYGVLNVAGAAYAEPAINVFKSLTGGSTAIAERTLSNPEYLKTVDQRIKAVVAFAPWGMERGVWDDASLKNLKVPTFFVSGSHDDISGYEKGVKAIYDKAINAERYLLTYLNARHNVAPNPPPPESLQKGLPFDEYYRYAEPSWDENRLNNINQHFVTAFLGIHLKNQDFKKYLEGQVNSNDKTWPGFKARASTGMELHHGVVEK